MKIFLLDTYYPKFLSAYYAEHSQYSNKSYETQLKDLLNESFGTSDFYSRHLKDMGHDVSDFIVNCHQLQGIWAEENDFKINRLALKLPQGLNNIPMVGPWISKLRGLVDIAVEQIKREHPEVLYCQDLWFLSPKRLDELRPYIGLIVGQIASPLPPRDYLLRYDLITTSFPHFVPRLQSMGIAAEYFQIGFDSSVLRKLGNIEKNIDVSFIGGVSRHHVNAIPILEYLANHSSIEFYGYGAKNLSVHSPIRKRHRGEVWGIDMYRALSRSRITLNRHIKVAENNANNMRLFEATGVGTLLLTDAKENLSELFHVGKEILAYSNAEEAVELIQYYLSHPDEAEVIAKAGQARTLNQHTYRNRMKELAPILEYYLSKKLGTNNLFV
jgi:spore maturation protein CgeB